MNLLDFLRLVDPQKTALISESGSFSFGELIARAENLRASLAGALGIRVLINVADPISALIACAALDGHASAIGLTSRDHDPQLVTRLFSRSACEVILSDRDDLDANLPVVRDLADFELLEKPKSPPKGPTAWMLATSGTTGTPKLVAHQFRSLIRTTKLNQAAGQAQTWGLLYDYTRFAGLQVLLQSLLAGATLVITSGDHELMQRIEFLAKMGVTHLSATPTLWRRILMTPSAELLPLRQVTLGGEIADDAILSALTRRYPQARISHIFASTEAGVGFSVSDKRAGFPIHFLKAPPLGIGLRIENHHLLIRNEDVAPCYIGEDTEVARSGWVNTGDEVTIKGDRVHFLGRSSGVINVGGNKVHPEEIETAILRHPEVAMAHVYAKKNPIVGALVASDVVPRNSAVDRLALRNDLTDWLSRQLERHKVPAVIRFVDEVRVNSAGKTQRFNKP